MAASPVLDSDVLIDYLRGVGPGSDLVRELGATLSFRITAVTAFELVLGRGYARDPRPVDALLAAPCLLLTREAAMRAGGCSASCAPQARSSTSATRCRPVSAWRRGHRW